MTNEFSTPTAPLGIDKAKSLQEQMAQAQQILDAGKASGTPSAVPPLEGAETITDAPEVSQEDQEFGPSDEELGITEDTKTAFFESILAGGQYLEEVSLFDGKLLVGFRSRTAGESEECLIDAGKQGAETVVEYELHLTLRYLAYSLAYIKNQEKGPTTFDVGLLPERLTRLRALPTPLYTALMQLGNKFDQKMGRLSNLSIKSDFWHPALAS